RGRDTYGVTAAMVARGALTAASSGFSGAGALAPSQAFEPSSFLEDLDRFGIEWEVEAAERPEQVRV
ncbi:MAG: saccharopine dehydrogenase family protein, partial [Solirubrobacterales bacterium]